MEKIKNENKIVINYQKRLTTVDLREIVAITAPNVGDKFFRVYFENFVWNVSIDQHDRLYKLWMEVESKSKV